MPEPLSQVGESPHWRYYLTRKGGADCCAADAAEPGIASLVRPQPALTRSSHGTAIILRNLIRRSPNERPIPGWWSSIAGRSHGGFEARLHFLGRDVFHMSRDRPGVAEGIGQCAGAVAVELIFQRPEHRGPRGDGTVEPGIDILDIDQKTHGSSLERLRSFYIHLGEFIGQHDSRCADQDLGVIDLPAGVGQAIKLDGSERLRIKVDRPGGIPDVQVGSDRGVSVRNRFDSHDGGSPAPESGVSYRFVSRDAINALDSPPPQGLRTTFLRDFRYLSQYTQQILVFSTPPGGGGGECSFLYCSSWP